MLNFYTRHKPWTVERLYLYSKTYLAYTFFLNSAFNLRFLITGVPKCGTSWVANIMSSVPGVHVEPEGTKAKNELIRLLLRNADFAPEDREVRRCLRQFKRMVVKKACLSGKNIIGDKTPAVLPESVEYAFPEARVLFLYRDGRDFIVSDAFHNLRMGRISDNVNKEQFWEDAIRRRSLYWSSLVLDVLPRYRDKLAEKLIEIRYEDLIDPAIGKGKVAEIFGHIGLPLQFLESAWEDNQFERLSGGRVRGEEDLKDFFRKGIAGDWKNHFTKKNHETFLELAGEGLQALNYEI